MNFTGAPAINGTPVNYAPARALDSPYVQTEWNSGIVRLSKGARTQVLDFTEVAAPHLPYDEEFMRTPYGRDVGGELVKAAREADIPSQG